MDNVTIDPPPNPGLSAVMMGDELRAYLLRLTREAAQLYKGRVHKVTHELEDSTTGHVITVQRRYGPRLAGEVLVDSAHFMPHEEGWTEDTDDGPVHHEGFHDMNAVLAELAGLPIPPTPPTAKSPRRP